jgi:hypothetical protein
VRRTPTPASRFAIAIRQGDGAAEPFGKAETRFFAISRFWRLATSRSTNSGSISGNRETPNENKKGDYALDKPGSF